MKKTISCLLVIVIMFNFIFCNICYAEPSTGGTEDRTKSPIEDVLMGDGTENTSAEPSNTIGADILEEGKVSQKNGSDPNVSTNSSSGGMSLVGNIIGIISLVLDIIPIQIQLLLSTISLTSVTDSSGEHTDFWLTIEKIVFGEVALFNANYFDFEDYYTLGTNEHEVTIEASNSVKEIKKSVTQIFFVCRIIAISIGLLCLIYIGIRMALSAVAEDKARYKKMLIAWVESFILLFTLIYIMSFINSIGKMLSDALYNMKCMIENSGEESFESMMDNLMFESITSLSGLRLAMFSLMYWVLAFSQMKFFYLYMKRLLVVGFLTMIAPLITITYSIDKAGDGKAQAFSAWFKEYIMNVLIQPLHAVIYLIFMFTAGEIARKAPILALAFLLSMGSVEKMIKSLFNMGNLVSLKNSDDFGKMFKKKK